MNVEDIRKEVAIAMLALLVGTWVGYFFASRTAQHSAIQQDCAHYDSKTGEFKWGPVQ
jgi:sensor domain CHASE-containing protein